MFGSRNIYDITNDVYDHHQIRIGNSDNFENRYKIKISKKEHCIKILKYNDFILILDEFKKFFKIPYASKFIAILNSHKYIAVKCDDEVLLKDMDIETLFNCSSFLNEIRRVFIFRYIMCLGSNNDSKIDVQMKKIKIGLNTTILYIPVCSKEVNYKTEFNSESNHIPKVLVEKWFDDKYELVYDTIKEMLADVDIDKFKIFMKDVIFNHIKSIRNSEEKDDIKRLRELESLIWWCNAVYDRMRDYSS